MADLVKLTIDGQVVGLLLRSSAGQLLMDRLFAQENLIQDTDYDKYMRTLERYEKFLNEEFADEPQTSIAGIAGGLFLKNDSGRWFLAKEPKIVPSH